MNKKLLPKIYITFIIFFIKNMLFATSIEKEIFANLFSLRNDKKAYALVKSIIPNTVKEFEKRLDELEKQ